MLIGVRNVCFENRNYQNLFKEISFMVTSYCKCAYEKNDMPMLILIRFLEMDVCALTY